MTPSHAYVIGTMDTKAEEMIFVRDLIRDSGIGTILIDVGIRSDNDEADITPSTLASHHPNGPDAVFVDDRGTAVSAMSLALRRFMATRDDVGGLIGLGGSGGTVMITPAMRDIPIGIPKLMVSTLASGDVANFVGPSDIMMIYPVTDLANCLNRVSRRILANAACGLAGMMKTPEQAADLHKPAIGMSMFGVTTPCVTAIVSQLEADYDCLVFHATGTGGRSLEKLIDQGDISAVLDITTTEICDLLVGGVLSAGEDRLDAVARAKIPFIGSCGALDMVNFWGLDSVPERFRSRTLYRHNDEITLMRTSAEECQQIGDWIGGKLNACDGEVDFFLPMKGVSALDIKGGAFFDPTANEALFSAIRSRVKPSARRRLHDIDLHINDPQFADIVVETFKQVMAKTGAPTR